MQKFILRRLGYSVLAIIGVTMLVFGLSRMIGDPRDFYVSQGGYGVSKEAWEEQGRKLHLDKPVPVQYGYWLWDLVRGDLGRDLVDGLPVTTKLKQKFGPTLKLGLSAWVLATAVGIPLGVLSAVKRGTVLDYVARVFALLGQTLPPFWIGLMSILLFTVHLGWLPSGTMGEGLAIRNYILPTITLAWLPAAGYLRLTRSAMLEVLDSEYVKMARAKGVGSLVVIWKHAFRNALLVPLTVSALVLAGFITGVVIIEVIFNWPGLGRLAVEAVWNNNLPVLTATTLIFTAIFVVMNFLTDIAYAYVDPRIRYG